MSLYHQMVKEENTISLSASAAGLHFEPIFAKHEAENQRKVKETKDGVEQLALAMVQPPPPTQAGTPTKSTAAKAARPVVPADDLLDLSMLSQMAPASFRVNLKTTKGDVLINVTRAWAPVGVDRFFNLVRAGYYSNCVFYRVMPHFIAQFGISARPEVNRAWMNADIPDDAPNGRSNKRGKVTFAKAGPNTRTTILFINLADNAYLDALGFVPIGEVVEGIENADQLYNGYGDTAQQQPSFAKGGKAFVDQQFPKLDRIITATLAPLNPSETMAR
jgi:peptidyl-prolyl cis-trans isomerase A (cyclophilin A)